MKIEKLTENKIKIILRREDFKNKNIDIEQLLLSKPDSQKLFLELLDRAEKEVNFNTDGHKLFIDTLVRNNDVFVCTITKSHDISSTKKLQGFTEFLNSHSLSKNAKPKKTLKLKKPEKVENAAFIYKFDDFENFLELCDFLHNSNIKARNLCKSCILYLHNSSFYLVVENINVSNRDLLVFGSSLAEFATRIKYNKDFKFKLKEYGKIVVKNNAINIGINYFSH